MNASAPASLQVDVQKHFPAFSLDVCFHAGHEILVLLGPSGAGKTTILNILAGLLEPDSGEIRFNDLCFFRRGHGSASVSTPARERRIGYLFQNFALFPHLTALGNVAFGLRRGPERLKRAAELLEQVQLSPLSGHRPRELSGGQQQRVALARALAIEPRLLLLDEPFSALDVAARERLQRDLRALHEAAGIPIIYVTHRLDDAVEFGDRLAVVDDGCIAQTGRFAELREDPASAAVARSVGTPNLFAVPVRQAGAGALTLDWFGTERHAPPRQAAPGATVPLYIPPCEIELLEPGTPAAQNQLRARIVEHRHTAAGHTLRLELENGRRLELSLPANHPERALYPGGQVEISIPQHSLRLLP